MHGRQLVTWLGMAASPGSRGPLPPLVPRPAVHLHFHGVSAEDVAAIIRQQQPAAQPAIEED